MPTRRQRSMSALLADLKALDEAHEKELATLRRLIERLKTERDELAAQVRFVSAQANRDTLAAAKLRAELLERSGGGEADRFDFCGGEGCETTAVLPNRWPGSARHRVRDDETERVVRPS